MVGKYIWKVDPEGNHQLFHVRPNFEARGSIGTYRCPSIIDYDDITLVIFTQYWEGVFPIEVVLKIDKKTFPVVMKEVSDLK